MRARPLLLFAALSLTVPAAYAGPSDAQVIKDFTKPGLIKLTTP